MAIDLATLGLTVKNDAAVAAIDATGRKLDEMGQKGDAAASKVSTAGQRVEASMQRQAKVVRDLSGEYDRLTKDDLAAAVAKFDAMYGPATKAADATTKVAKATKEMAEVSESAGAGLGRVRQGLTSMLAQLTGTAPVLDRVAGTLGSFVAGTGLVIGVTAGLSAIAYAYDKLTQSARETTAAQDEAIASLEKLRRAQSLGAGGETSDNVTKAQARIAADRARIAFLTPLTTVEPGGDVSGVMAVTAARDAAKAKAEIEDLKKDIQAGEVEVAGLRQKSAEATDRARVDDLASLIQHNHATKAQYDLAVQLYRGYVNELAILQRQNPGDQATQAGVSSMISTLHDALHPKSAETAAQRDAAGRMRVLNEQMDATTRSVLAMMKGAGAGNTSAFIDKGLDPLDAKTIVKGAQADLSKGGVPMFQSALDRVTILQAQLDAQNASRAASGQKALGPSKDLLEARKAADDYGSAIIDGIARSNASWQTQAKLIDEIIKKLKEAGALVPKVEATPSGLAKIAGDVAGGLHTAGDLANLIGGRSAERNANLLNTAGNAVSNVKNALANPISIANIATDFQAVTSVVALGKEVFGLGKQSHDAARQVAEASEAVKNMLAQLQASVSHDALGSLLAQAQAADDARKKQINDDLSGKKKENERNKALAQDAQLYAQQVQQIQQQYTIQQGFDLQSLQARLLAAKGLTYQAQQAELAVKQQEEYNKAVLDGRDATYLATLAQVQLAEKTQLANDAITQLANSPTGFFAERYFGDYAIPTVTPSTPSTNGGNGGNTITITGPISIPITGVTDPDAVAKKVVGALRTFASQTVGNGGTIASAIDLYPT